MKLHNIVKNLYSRGHTKNLDSRYVVEQMHQLGITVVVCVAPQKDAALEAAMSVIGMTYIHEPMSDGSLVCKEQIDRIVNKVVKNMEHTGVIVHCRAGRNRSMLIATLAAARATGVTPYEMMQQLRQERPNILANSCFEQYIQQHE